MNGFTMARIRTILNAAKFEKKWWSHALSYVTFSNCMPQPRVPGKTPYFDKALHSKLDNSAVKGILVGYDTGYSYEVYVKEFGRVLVSRHVVFMTVSAEVFSPEDLPAKDLPAVAPEEIQVSPLNPVAAPPVRDGHKYRPYWTSRNSGQKINESNIIQCLCCRTTASFEGMTREHDSSVFVMLSKDRIG